MPQSLDRVPIHIIFSTHQRVPLLTPEIREKLHPYMSGILRNEKCVPLQVGGIEDHVHILTGLPRTVTIAHIVENVKTGSTKWLKANGPGCANFAWQAGYCVVGVGPDQIQEKIRYIQNQVEHHRSMTFQEEYRRFLDEAGIPYDERYVWD